MARRPIVRLRVRSESVALGGEAGFTLIEVMVSMLVLLVGVLGTVQLFDGASAATGRTKAREGGNNLTREVIEATRSVPYPKVINASLLDELQAQPGLGDASASGGWQLRRRDITYDVDVSVCLVDDPKDGLGQHDATAFCEATGGTADQNPDDYKRVTATVTWKDRTGRPTQVKQSTVIENPGTGAGPPVKTLTMTSPTSSPVTSPVSAIQFALTTSATATTVSWLVDGQHQGAATGSGSSWSFSWPISSLYDGSYLVSAQAYDQYGSPGPAKVTTVVLNRNAPLAPPGFTGGWNGTFVEFEWLPNSEGDIEGYRLYREDSTGPTPICGLSGATTCKDLSPPDQPSTTYYVVAVDKDPGGNLREGAKSTKTVVQANNPPNPPTSVTASKDAYGNTVLSWAAPSPADPDTGDSIDFYRIYRDGSAVADRYDRTGTGEVNFVDRSSSGMSHSYWVSAVDTHYAESTLVGPVTK